MRLSGLLLAALSLTACASPPPRLTEEEVKQADIGPVPVDGKYEATTLIKSCLKDPDSAEIEWTNAFPARGSYLDEDEDRYRPAWWMQAWVNSKNSFGGYTGKQLWSFYWVHGLCVKVVPPQE